MRFVLYVLAALLLTLCGCASQEARDRDPMVIVKQAAALGLEAEATFIYGTAHAAGIPWNLTGSNGVIVVKVKPDMTTANAARTVEP